VSVSWDQSFINIWVCAGRVPALRRLLPGVPRARRRECCLVVESPWSQFASGFDTTRGFHHKPNKIKIKKKKRVQVVLGLLLGYAITLGLMLGYVHTQPLICPASAAPSRPSSPAGAPLCGGGERPRAHIDETTIPSD
jgi:hypothetical protein